MAVKYRISLLFGEQPEEGDTAKIFDFDTPAEAEAFRMGIEEGVGWLGARCVPEDFVMGSGISELDDLPLEGGISIHEVTV